MQKCKAMRMLELHAADHRSALLDIGPNMLCAQKGSNDPSMICMCEPPSASRILSLHLDLLSSGFFCMTLINEVSCCMRLILIFERLQGNAMLREGCGWRGSSWEHGW